MYASRSLRRLLTGTPDAIPDAGPASGHHPRHDGVRHLQRKAGNRAVASTLGGAPLVAAEDPAHEAAADTVSRKVAGVTPVRDPRGTPQGAPLAPEHQEVLQRFVGGDLSQVRIHTGPESQRANAALGAHAFARGSDIHFGSGEYDPGSRKGFGLLAHEVAHAVEHPTPSTSDGRQLVHAKLKGTRQALVSLGGDKDTSFRKKISGSKWNDLLSQLSKYEAMESAYQATLAGGGNTQQQAKDERKLLDALLKLEKAALAWRQSNDPDAAAARSDHLKNRRAIDPDDLDGRAKSGKWQAVGLFLVRLRTEKTDLESGRYRAIAGTGSGGFDDSALSWGRDNAVGGGVNRLDEVAYATAGKPILEGYFKEDRAFASAIEYHEKDVGIHQHDPNYGGRSVAMYRLDQLLQGGVIARTEFGVHTSRNAPGKTGSLWQEAASTKFGFVTEKAQGRSMIDLAAKGRLALTTGQQQRGSRPGAPMVDLNDATLQRCLNKLQVIDAIAGQLDRHEGNFFVAHDATGKVTGVTGIDNDMAFGAAMTAPDHRSARGAHNYLGLPDLIDEAFGERILQVTDDMIEKTLAGLLSPEEIDATVQRFAAVRAAVQQMKKSKKLTKTWNSATAEGQWDTAMGKAGGLEKSFLGRTTESFVWGATDKDARAWLEKQGLYPSDSAILLGELKKLVRAGTVGLDEVMAVSQRVFQRLLPRLELIDPTDPVTKFASLNDVAVIRQALHDVLQSNVPQPGPTPSGRSMPKLPPLPPTPKAAVGGQQQPAPEFRPLARNPTVPGGRRNRATLPKRPPPPPPTG